MSDNQRGLLNAKIGPTPRNAMLGLLADALGSVDRFANVPDPTDPTQKGRKIISFLSNTLGVGDMASVADRASYGLPQTTGTGFARQLMPDAKNVAAGLFPSVAANPAAAAKIAVGLLNPGDTGLLNQAMHVWHGSPHKFDAFDSSKIGTGEGAQAYGHGLYLAESPDVATQYQKTVSSRVKSANVGGDVPVGDARGIAHEIATVHGGNVEEFIKSNRLHYDVEASRASAIGNNNRAKVLREIADENEAIARQFFGKPVTAAPDGGMIYKVDLPDEKIARMLDWYKPLSQQAPEVQKAAAAIFAKMDPDARKLVGNSLGDMKGKRLYELMASDDSVAGAGAYGAAASSAFRSAGIPGIRYLDGGSRGAGGGTSNFVVFPGEETALRILERNGQPLR
jgi:hypothetical protein